MRSPKGAMLVETLVTTTIMGVIGLAFMSVLLMNMKTSAKVNNMTDTINAVRTIKERIGKDVREGRTLGDVFGDNFTDPSSGIEYTIGSASFPCNRNPVYGTGAPTPAGWSAPPYTLSNTCLIVQIPVLDNHNDSGTTHALNAGAVGWPTLIPQGAGNPAAPCNQDNVETHVYRVLADPDNTGEYILQLASYGGRAVTGYLPAAHTSTAPQTILKGIIGPMDTVTGLPKVFQFVNKTDLTGTPRDSILPDGAHSPEYTGVVVNLEVRRHQFTSTTRRDISITPVGLKLEVFLRNNALATTAGQPSNIP